MSASTRTIQQPLGFGQIGAALAVVALALMVAALVFFGSMGTAKTDVAPAAGAPPAVIDHGWSQAGTSTGPAAGAPPAVIDHGWSKAGTSPNTPAYQGDPGFAPRQPSGKNPRLGGP